MSIPLSGSRAIKRVLVILAFCLLSLFLFGSVVSVGVLYPFNSSLKTWKSSRLRTLKALAEKTMTAQASSFEDWMEIHERADPGSKIKQFALEQMIRLGSLKRWKELSESLSDDSEMKKLAIRQVVKSTDDEQLAIAFFDTNIFYMSIDVRTGLEIVFCRDPNLTAQLILDKLVGNRDLQEIKSLAEKAPAGSTLRQFYLWKYTTNIKTFEEAKRAWLTTDGVAKHGALMSMRQIVPTYGECVQSFEKWKQEFWNAPKDSELRLLAWREMVQAVHAGGTEWFDMCDQAQSLPFDYQRALFARIYTGNYYWFREWRDLVYWLSKYDCKRLSTEEIVKIGQELLRTAIIENECKEAIKCSEMLGIDVRVPELYRDIRSAYEREMHDHGG